MQSSDITRGGNDPIYRICRNTEASADMADGEVVVYDVTTTAGRDHGADVIKATAASQLVVAGVAKGAILNGDYGRIQVFGFHPNVKTTAAALAAGLIVNTDAAAAALAANVAGAGLGVSLKLGAANRAGIFIKTMGI